MENETTTKRTLPDGWKAFRHAYQNLIKKHTLLIGNNPALSLNVKDIYRNFLSSRNRDIRPGGSLHDFAMKCLEDWKVLMETTALAAGVRLFGRVELTNDYRPPRILFWAGSEEFIDLMAKAYPKEFSEIPMMNLITNLNGAKLLTLDFYFSRNHTLPHFKIGQSYRTQTLNNNTPTFRAMMDGIQTAHARALSILQEKLQQVFAAQTIEAHRAKAVEELKLLGETIDNDYPFLASSAYGAGNPMLGITASESANKDTLFSVEDRLKSDGSNGYEYVVKVITGLTCKIFRVGTIGEVTALIHAAMSKYPMLLRSLNLLAEHQEEVAALRTKHREEDLGLYAKQQAIVDTFKNELEQELSTLA